MPGRRVFSILRCDPFAPRGHTRYICRRPFELASDYSPQGDQAQAIAKLTKSILAGHRHQTLLGVTGSGKT